IPQKLADRLKDYIREKGIQSHQRIFPICYEAAREMVAKAGSVVGIHLRPHDLRRHAATYASRSGVPIEIVSKVILRHSNLSTTERYLGKISDVEAIKWIPNPCAASSILAGGTRYQRVYKDYLCKPFLLARLGEGRPQNVEYQGLTLVSTSFLSIWSTLWSTFWNSNLLKVCLSQNLI
ncbi:MAG: site-specific integrase, partial [Deltaproteobacteria bacterium]|nr:site-specific integrase [Deltaproteobacteria bacterium]